MTSEDKKRRDFINKRVNLGQDRESAAEEYEKTKDQVLSPDLSTLEKKREFLVGKTLSDSANEDGVLGEIEDLEYSKIKNRYIVILEGGKDTEVGDGKFSFLEEDFNNLLKGESSGGFFIDELKPKQEPEENISITKEALQFLSTQEGESEQELLNQLQESDKEKVEKLIKKYPIELKLTESNGDVLIEFLPIEITPSEVVRNSPDFKYYALTKSFVPQESGLKNTDKIVFGAEYKEDVRSFISDRKKYIDLRLVSKRDLPIDANLNENWIEDSSEKIELRKRILGWWEAETKELADEDTVAAIAGNAEQNKDFVNNRDQSQGNISEDKFKQVVRAYGDYLLKKKVCAIDYLMPHTEKALLDEYKKLEMFY